MRHAQVGRPKAPRPGQRYLQLDEAGTELFDAMMSTFAPELPSDDVNCRASGACRLLSDGVGGGGFGARNIGFYIHIPSITKPQAPHSTRSRSPRSSPPQRGQ